MISLDGEKMEIGIDNKNNENDNLLSFSQFISYHHPSVTTLLLTLESSSQKINDIYNLNFSDKYEMKTIGGTANILKTKISELLILGIAKVIEDSIWNIIDLGNIDKFKFWDCNNIRFYKNVKLVRHVANIIKHNRSVIFDETINSRDANALIQEYNFTPSHNICNYFENNDFEMLYKSIYYTDVFCIDLFCKKLDMDNKYKKDIREEDIVQHLKKHYLEDFNRLGIN